MNVDLGGGKGVLREKAETNSCISGRGRLGWLLMSFTETIFFI